MNYVNVELVKHIEDQVHLQLMFLSNIAKDIFIDIVSFSFFLQTLSKTTVFIEPHILIERGLIQKILSFFRRF